MPSISQVIKDDHHCLIELRQQVFTSKDKDAMTKKFLQELYQHLDVETHMLDPLLPKTLPGREQRIECVGRMREKCHCGDGWHVNVFRSEEGFMTSIIHRLK
ncbi:hypothetical protein S40288_11454 [Stachybotrys chartarum IBT 40288]|nr:hypothetical protein S40288_11454 [Stachybotrys chartarum IBT 40288]